MGNMNYLRPKYVRWPSMKLASAVLAQMYPCGCEFLLATLCLCVYSGLTSLSTIFSSPEPKKALSSIVHTFEQLYLHDQLANFISSIFGVGEAALSFWADQIKQNWLPWQQKAPIDILSLQNCVPVLSVNI